MPWLVFRTSSLMSAINECNLNRQHRCSLCGKQYNGPGVYVCTVDPSDFPGMGDYIASVLKRMGFKECPGCTKRKRYLNKVFSRDR